MYSENFLIIYSSLNINRLIKARRMRWVAQVAHTGGYQKAYRVPVEKSGPPPMHNERIILKYILERYRMGGID